MTRRQTFKLVSSINSFNIQVVNSISKFYPHPLFLTASQNSVTRSGCLDLPLWNVTILKDPHTSSDVFDGVCKQARLNMSGMASSAVVIALAFLWQPWCYRISFDIYLMETQFVMNSYIHFLSHQIKDYNASFNTSPYLNWLGQLSPVMCHCSQKKKPKTISNPAESALISEKPYQLQLPYC